MVDRPIKEFKEKNISLAVWAAKDKDGKDIESYTLSKGYMDKDKKWVNQRITLFKAEVVALKEVLTKI